MLSKQEIRERYKKHAREFTIRKEPGLKRFSSSFLDKAFHNLEVAGILTLLTRYPEKKGFLGIASDERYHDWIIVASYYSMYMAATAALSALGLKSVTHGGTVIALEYWYCIETTLLERKYIAMIKDTNFGREDVGTFDYAMKRRVAVQYTVTDRHAERESKRILVDAKTFVGKISDIIKQ